MSHGSLDASEIFLTFQKSSAWPPTEASILFQTDLDKGVARLLVLPSAQMLLQVWANENDGTKTLVTAVTSCPLIGGSGDNVLISLAWDGKESSIRVNTVLVGTTSSTESVPAEYSIWRGNDQAINSLYDDLTKKNEKAQRKRKQRYISRVASHGVAGVNLEYLAAALRAEILQISDLLDNVQSGRIHHIPGLSARLRLLIVSGEPMPLLQMCAAAHDLPLTVYTTAWPRMPLPVTPASMITIAISSEPNGMQGNPVDLEVWLHLRAAVIGTMEFSNARLLREIGNTVGAHVDHEMAPAVLMLRASKMGHEKMPISVNLLDRYIQQVAQNILPISKAVLLQCEKSQ